MSLLLVIFTYSMQNLEKYTPSPLECRRNMCKALNKGNDTLCLKDAWEDRPVRLQEHTLLITFLK